MLSRAEPRKWSEGWCGVGLVAIACIYFLIFAQFGFLKRLADLNLAGNQLRVIMGAMAVGGIAISLLASRFEGRWLPALRLQAGFFGCAIAAILTLLPMSFVTAAAVSLSIGVSLGLLTVTLVTHLNSWIGTVCPFVKIGLGVGVAYFVCNCPLLFEARPTAMAIVSAGLCCVGIGLATRNLGESPNLRSAPVNEHVPQFWLVLGCFTALVWLDSSAFFIIQNSPALKAGTWVGASRLWQNGGVHFLAALGSGVLLNRRGLLATLSWAFVCLAGACLLLIEPRQPALAGLLLSARRVTLLRRAGCLPILSCINDFNARKIAFRRPPLRRGGLAGLSVGHRHGGKSAADSANICLVGGVALYFAPLLQFLSEP